MPFTCARKPKRTTTTTLEHALSKAEQPPVLLTGEQEEEHEQQQQRCEDGDHMCCCCCCFRCFSSLCCPCMSFSPSSFFLRSFNLFSGKNSSITISSTTTSSLRLPLTLLHHRSRTRAAGREHERVIRQMITPLAPHSTAPATQSRSAVERRETLPAGRTGNVVSGGGQQQAHEQTVPTYIPTYSSRYLFIVTVPTHLDFIGTYQSGIYHVL